MSTDPESVRIEVAFAGGPIIGANVPPSGADALEQALSAGAQGTHQLDTTTAASRSCSAASRT